jgi:endonuclease V-like protein UPF0215 family
VKTGARSCGIAFSDGQDVSSCAAAVVRADRVVDGLRFGQCTVGGLDATEVVVDVLDALDRPDVQYLFLAGVAPAWFNLLDLRAIHEATALPTLAVSFEASGGLGDAIRDHFSGDERTRRLALYDSLPRRQEVRVGDDRLFVRALGFDAEGRGDDTAEAVVRAFTPEGGRPEPLRVARLAARAAREAREASGAAATESDTAESDTAASRPCGDDGERRG